MTTLIISSSLACAFGAPDLLPSAEREKSYSFATKLDKKKAFQKIVVWSAKTFANANETIKLKDAEMGMLVAKGNLSCKALNVGNGYAENQRIEFTLEISVDNKKAEIKATDVIGRGDGAYDDSARPSKKEEMNAAAKECLDPYVDGIKKELQ